MRAVVLASRPLGEADRVLRLFTRELGRVDAVVKGVRKTTSRWGGRLEPYAVSDLLLYQGRSLSTVTQAQLVDVFRRLREQRDFCYNLLVDIPGVSCVKPAGALYMFPKLDVERFGITDDEHFVLDFLREKKVLLVHGRGFNWPEPNHFRIVFLPRKDELGLAMNALRDFLADYRQEQG